MAEEAEFGLKSGRSLWDSRKEKGNMEQKIYNTMKTAGAVNIAIGVIVIVTGIVSGVLLIVTGGKLIVRKSGILF